MNGSIASPGETGKTPNMTAVLQLDDALATRLKEAADLVGVPFEQAAQEALRRGVQQMPRRVVARPYRLPVHDFGGHVENPAAALAALEEDEFRQQFGAAK